MLTIRAISNGEGYDSRHLSNNDYYAEGERVTGHWFGRGAERLGLAGEVTHEQFEAIRQGHDPATGEFLRERHSADRIAADGSVQGKARHFCDFTFSAPKSVSIMAEITGDDRLVDAHRRAVEEALREMEVHASARVRRDGANDDRSTGNLVVAVYHHDTSRELDPQLHAHAVAGNLTYDEVEGRWKALKSSGIYERRAYLSEVYRNALAGEVLRLGYEIEDRRDSKGNDAGFEIAGVGKALVDKYSQRSQQRDAAIAEFVAKRGRAPTDNEIAVLVRETRAEKLTEIATEEVERLQRSRLAVGEAGALRELREQAAPVPAERVRAGVDVRSALIHAEEHVFERLSVARDFDLFTEALRKGRGRMELAELHGILDRQEQTGEVFRYRTEIATQASLDRERQMIAAVNRGVGKFAPLVAPYSPTEELRAEQKHAVEFVLASRDLAVNLRGAAGTGKTRTLQELDRALVQSGREVLAVAPTTGAVDELRKVGFREGMTLSRLLEDDTLRRSARGKVVILDEAGMVSGREMAQFLALAETQSMRVVFSGDTRQLRSVEAGDALRILEADSRLKSTALTQVQRQKPREYREAIEELRRNPTRGFERLETMGAVREVPLLERAEQVQRAYSEAAALHGAKNGSRSVLVVAATHDEVTAVTDAIRAQRKTAGELTGSVAIDRHVPLNFTLAQKKDARSYSEGQLLVFHRAVTGVRKNEVLEVERVDGRDVIARSTSSGARRALTARQAKAFEVFERRPFELATNDRVLLTANWRDKTFRATNGEIATVSRVDGHGRIHLEDGRVIPASYRQIDHGYAITTHRSQGKTVDAVVISVDAMRKELFYVAASRGRESVTVITSDVAGLRESIRISGERPSALELHERKATVRERAYAKSLAYARHHRSPVPRKTVVMERAEARQGQRLVSKGGIGYGI